jgi:hypothetical protein
MAGGSTAVGARPIFRAQAVRRYTERGTQGVLPRFTSPATTRCLWALGGLLLAAIVTAWLMPVPVVAGGPAAVAASTVAGDGPAVAVLLPADEASRVRAGQAVAVRLAGAAEPWSGNVVAVEPAPIGPAAARARFGLPAGDLAGPYRVALARVDPSPAGGLTADYEGSAGQADIVVGARPVIELLPGLGALWGGEDR